MRTLSPRPSAVVVAVLISLLVASIPAWAGVGILGNPPPTTPGAFTTQPPAFGRDPAPTWSWEASTPGGAASIAKYHVRVKPGSHDWVDAVPAIVNAPNTGWSPSPAFSADGIYQIAVQAEDSDGVKSDWAVSSTYVLDTTPPDVALSVPEAGLETSDANIVFRGTAEDLPWGIAAVHWMVTDPSGNPVAGSAQFTEPNAAFTPSSALSVQGVYAVRLFAEDRAGNTATAERSFRLDTIDPTMTQYELLTAKSRMLYGDLYISDTQPKIRVVASDGSSGSGFNVDGSLEIEVFSDGAVPERVEGTVLRTPARPTLNAEAWAAVWSPSAPMTSGRYYPWITIIDDAGNKLERGGPAYRFVIDADPPQITGDSSVGKLNTGNGRQFTNNRHPLITWSAAFDPNLAGGVPGAGVAGYQLEVWTKPEEQSKPQGTKVYAAPGIIDPWADLMPITPTGGPVEQHTPSAELNGLKDGVSYGAWILVRDRVGNVPQEGAEPIWVDPPFIFDSSPPSLPGIPIVVDAVEERIGTGTPTIRWEHATDERFGVAQSGVDGYEVRMKHAGATSWDVLTTFVDLDPDEDVDCVDADTPLEGDLEWVVPQLLANGDYEFVLRARDVAGNVSVKWTDSLFFTVDTTPLNAPEAPYTASPTNKQLPEWTWLAVAGAVRYGVYLDGALKEYVLPPEIPGAPLTWAPAEGAELAEGRHYLQVTAVNDLGNESEKSAPGYVDIDLTPPARPVMQALPGFTNKDEVLFQWDAEADAVRYELEYRVGEADSQVTSVDVAQYVLDIPDVTDGIAVWGRAKAYDAAGNASGWAAPVARTVIDRTGPTVTDPTIPVTPTTDPRPIWAWTGDDGELGSGVSHYVVTLDSSGSFETAGASFTPASDLADGTHVLKVKGVDNVGNVGEEFVFPGVAIDTLPPAAPAIGPIAKGYNTSPLTLRWSTVTDGDNAVEYVLQWAKNAGFSGAHSISVGPVEVTPECEFGFTEPGKGEDEYWFRVKTISTVNASTTPRQTKESGWSAAVSTIYDVTPPGAPALALETPSRTNQSPQRWSWTAPEGAVGYEVRVNSESTDDWEDIGDACTRETTFTESGTYTFEARAYDWLRNKNDSNIAFGEVEVDVTAPDIPTGLSVVTPTTDRTPQWTWDNPGEEADDDLEGYQALLDGTELIDVGLLWTYTHSETLGNGAHALQVRAYDDLGNKSEWCDAVTVVVDTESPATPAIDPIAKGYNTSPLTLRWSTVTDGDNAVEYVLQWAKDAGFSEAHDIPVGPVAGIPECEFDFAVPGRGEGEYWFRVKTISTVNGSTTPPQTKESGWSPAVSTIYDKTGPAASVLTLSTPSPTNQSPQTWNWTAPAGATGYKVSVDGGEWIDVQDTRTYQTTFDATGTYTFAVRAYDWLGNDGAAAAGSVEVDVTAPDAPGGLALVSESVVIDGKCYTADNTPNIKWDPSSSAVEYRAEVDGQAWIHTIDAAYEFTEGLEDGEHAVRVSAADALGNWSQYSGRLVFVVDTKPPLPPGTPSAATPINHGSPVWSWAAAEGAVSYRVFEDEVDRGFVAGPTYESSGLLEGSHYLQATALDILGNESDKSAPGRVDIDLTPPMPPVMRALPKFTNKNEVLFQWDAEADAVRFMLRYVIGDEDHTEVSLGVKKYALGISALEDGVTIQAMVRAFDDAGNAGDWPADFAVSTTVDRTGPNVNVLEPTAETHTNGRRPAWKWSSEEDGTSPAKDYRVTLAPEGRAESTLWRESPEFVPVSDLAPGKYVLKVAARDELGNIGGEQNFPAVYVVAPTVSTPIPSPGAYPVNKVSTLAFSVHGIWDAELEMKANDQPVPEENLITLLRSPALTKFYVLIDADMAGPGQRLTIEVTVGDMTWEFGYDVLTERSGFGFGRLRPWDW